MFEKAKVPSITAKIADLNETLRQDAHAMALEDDEVATLNALGEVLANRVSYHASKISAAQLALFSKLLKWPVESVFPAIDLFRVLVIHPSGAKHVAAAHSGVVELVDTLLAHAHSPGAAMPVVLCTARALANMVAAEPIRSVIVGGGVVVLRTILDGVDPILDHTNKSVGQAIATLLLSVAGTLHEAARGNDGGAAGAAQEQCTVMLCRLATVQRAEQDPTTVSRALQGLAIAVQDRDFGAANMEAVRGGGIDVAGLRSASLSEDDRRTLQLLGSVPSGK